MAVPAASNPLLQPANTSFAPMYYSSPIKQIVLTQLIGADDTVTASITAGSPYFAVTTMDVCTWAEEPTGPQQIPNSTSRLQAQTATPAKAGSTATTPVLTGPVASSNGSTPLSVVKGQYVRVWVTANIPQGASLAAGAFTGTVLLKGKSVNHSAALSGTYLGNLIGSVSVQPQVVVPGQSVLVQVLDAAGQPISDPATTVTIQGVPASSRYYQFPTTGSRTLIVVASRGTLSESAQATVAVTGAPLQFRATLNAPATYEIPLLQASPVPGQPYAATFSVGLTDAIRRVLAATIAQTDAAKASAATAAVAPSAPAVLQARAASVSAGATAAPLLASANKIAARPVLPAGAPSTAATAAATAAAATPSSAFASAVAKLLTGVPTTELVRPPPVSVTNSQGTATGSAELAMTSVPTIQPEQTSYQWDFGDGQTETTQTPTVTHDFFPSIQAGDITRGFKVSCTVVHDNNLCVIRTLVMHSAYGLCRQLGAVVPPVVGDTFASFQQVGFSTSLIVTNLEASPISITAMACVPLSDDTTVIPPTPQFTNVQVPLTVAAKSSSAIGSYIALNLLQIAGVTVNAFALYYSGEMTTSQGTVPVRFSYVFRIPLTDSGYVNATLPPQTSASNWNVGTALQAVTAMVAASTGAVSPAGGQTADPTTKTIAIALSADPQSLATRVQVRAAIQAGLTAIALNTGALTTKGVTLRLPTIAPKAPIAPAAPSPGAKPAPRLDQYNPLSPPPVAAGNQCYPDDISDADAATASGQQLVCQLTSTTESVTVPASFQNAQAGDVILSPAPVSGGDLIAGLFRALTPPQHHGHSGIMTANFYEVTHCTASSDRIIDNVNKDAAGIPTSLNSSILQYGWPGSIVQSVGDATSTVILNDPSNTPYSFNSFNPTAQGDGFEIIPPLVVKPLPENEATVRPLLRKAAATARSKGAQYDSNGNMVQQAGCYYSFYAYTNPGLSAGFTDAASSDAGWATGLSPAVCSSFVWLSLKENNIPLVTQNQYEALSDLSPSAVAGGAQVGATTLDGLFFYPQAERLQGAQALYQMILDLALSSEYSVGNLPLVNSTIGGPIADQLINMFAVGNANLPGSTAWQTPGDGNAVSPDNIIWWNPPYYGYAEPLQFLPAYTEQYTTSQWNKVTTWGTITGTVQANGVPVANAHVWVYLPGGDTYTAADGSFTLNQVPIGAYSLMAQAVVVANGISEECTNGSGQPVTLTAASPNVTQDLQLQPPSQAFRQLDLTYSISCDHSDGNPGNTHGTLSAGPYTQSLYANPGTPTNSLSFSYDYAGGGYFTLTYLFTIGLLDDNSLMVTVAGTMKDDGSGDIQSQFTAGPFTVPPGGSWSGNIDLSNSGTGYTNGPSTFSFSVTNNQQTG